MSERSGTEGVRTVCLPQLRASFMVLLSIDKLGSLLGLKAEMFS